MVSMLATKANSLAAEVTGNAGAINPGLLALLQQILAALVSFLQTCGQSPVQALQTAQHPGPFARLRVRRVTRRELALHPDLAGYQGKIEDGVFTLARGTSVEEMTELFEDVS